MTKNRFLFMVGRSDWKKADEGRNAFWCAVFGIGLFWTPFFYVHFHSEGLGSLRMRSLEIFQIDILPEFLKRDV